MNLPFRKQILGWGWPLLLVVSQLSACDAADEATTYKALTPSAPVLPRLTRTQFANVVNDVFGEGLAMPPQLEPDNAIGGLLSVGASIATVSSRGVELYEDAARSLARQVVEKPGRLGELLPCTLPAATPTLCLQTLVDRLAPRLWRRPATAEESAAIVAIGTKAASVLGSEKDGVEYALLAMLQSPNLLYRSEIGEPDPANSGSRRLTAYELAGKMALVLWAGAPDDALLAKAADGTLQQAKVLRAEAERMLADPRARRAVRAFVTEWLHLDALDGLNKDPKIFKHFSADLSASAREETLRTVDWLVFEAKANMRELLTTRTTFVDRRLAAIYDVPAAVPDGFGQVTLPAAGPRRGFLGQVAFLGSRSHPVSSSATLRGVFIREALLCEQVPLPPSNLNTAIPEPSTSAPTLKDRLLDHMTNPSCNGCHSYTDPPGFGLEPFDGIGRHRTHDNGATIDATGTIDGDSFDGPAELAHVVANNPRYRRCVVEKVYSFANGRKVKGGVQGALDRLEDQFGQDGMRLDALLVDVVADPSFRRVGPVETTTEGATP